MFHPAVGAATLAVIGPLIIRLDDRLTARERLRELQHWYNHNDGC